MEAQPDSPAPSFDALRRKLAGSLLEPGGPGYAELATPWNRAVATSPAAVVEAAGAQDVAEAVGFAAANGMPVAVQATGHGVASTMDGALLVHTRSLDTCIIDTDARTAATGAGVTWKTVLGAGHDPGLVGLCGSAPGVSVAGYTSGGGIGPMARTFGAASDRVLSFDVVTGDGLLRHATAATEPELFWGLRGGKGSLGIITGMEFELLPLAHIYAGALFFGTDDIPHVLRTWAQWCPPLPPEATTSVALMHLPPMPGVPEPLAGRFTVSVRYVYTGNADDGATWLAPMRSAGVPIMDMVGLIPSSMIGLVHSDPEDALPAAEGSMLLSDFTAGAADTLLDAAGPDSGSPQLMVEIRQFGGALAEEPEVPSALCHRQAGYGLYTVGVGAPPELPAIADASVALQQHMSASAYDGTLPNFSSGSGAGGFAANYTAPVLDRLSSLARHFDPDNVFRLGQVPTR
ncbi:FAD/FMN-containing dehydrogenase [Arthrobacter stackebrandtii]|uniref:FAD/FMN-containing dehydrogenase n=1 Tax=Arthrobacter stackebrandtii TaxID=272161 RepID=A0ABS4YVG0_9MICC|nr:FAD-binding oxidoreductase [Arthrobacter stackebrandtii]MBP2412787.1 FAD/FMN-containing dehydrogenase [Arthrobacter stackebrandtii]PYG99859.1 FAD-linked oxidase [Arthrobacter stackebrandtii]